jgi:SAM-dependent methyltransferase
MTEARLLQLHLGCGDCAPPDWINVDTALGARLYRVPGLRRLGRAVGLFRLDWPDDLFVHDLRRPFPWPDASARAVYSSHLLEHLTIDEGRRFLRECHRVLAPGGVVRIVVPDLRACIDRYLEGKLDAGEFVSSLGFDAREPGDGWLKRWLAPRFRFPHRCMYDAESLLAALREAGFEAGIAEPFESRIGDVGALERLDRTQDAVIVEGTKGAAHPAAMASS